MSYDKPLHIAIGADEFAYLVRGRTVEAFTGDGRSARVILSDIGWRRMLEMIEVAMRESMHDALEAEFPSSGDGKMVRVAFKTEKDRDDWSALHRSPTPSPAPE